MDIVEVIDNGSALGAFSWRVDIDGHSRVARACRVEVDDEDSVAAELRLVEASGVARWRQFVALTDEQRERLEVGPDRPIVGLRRWIEGTPLAELPGRAGDNWQQWGLDLAYILQAVHGQKIHHGALRPEEVIVPDDGRPRLVGVPVGPADAGSVPEKAAVFRAPEVPEQRPDRSADIYGLAAIVCWMATEGELETTRGDGEDATLDPVIPDSIDEPLAGLLRRSLMAQARARPSAAEFFDVMSEAVDARPYRFVGLPPGLYRGLETDVVEAIDRGDRAVVLEGDGKTGRTFTLRRLETRLQADGWTTVYATPDEIRGPDPEVTRETSLDRGPWEPLRRLVEALEGDPTDRDCEPPEAEKLRGDSLKHFRYWAGRLRDGLKGRGPTVVLWDDFDVSAPDVRAFFRSLLTDLAVEGDDQLRLVVATAPGDEWWEGARRFEVVGPSARAWKGWRDNTGLSQVRRIPEGRFGELVDQHGARPVEFIEAVNRALGVRRIPSFAEGRPTTRAVPEASVLFAGDWRRHLDELLDRGAHVQAVVTCRRIYEVLQRSHPRDRLQVLPPWLEAVAGSGFRPDFVEELREALVETAEPTETRTDAGLLLARLLCRTGRPGQGLEVLDELGELDDARRIEASRWRAQMLLAAGRIDGAVRAAQQGETLLAEAGRSYRIGELHFELVHRAAGAAEGDEEAIDRLRRLAVELEEADAPARLVARCHHWCGIGRSRQGREADAADAHLRAVETMESAGLIGQLPAWLQEVGAAHLRRGRFGLARQYLRRGSGLIHEGTPEGVRLRLWAETGDVELTLGAVDRAGTFVERMGEAVDEESDVDFQVRWCRLVGDVARLTGQPRKALEWYDRGLDIAQEVEHRASLLVAKAELALEDDDFADRANRWLERASRLVERHGLDEPRIRLGLVRGRLQRASDDELDRVGGNERLEIHLQEALDEGRYRLVLRQSARIWRELDDGADESVRRLVARVFHEARQVATSGLTTEMRAGVDEGLPEIPTVDELQARTEDGRDRVEQLENENATLRDHIERLEAELADRDDEIEQLREQVERLEERLEEAEADEDDSGSSRGRRPKASREEVVEALEATDHDHQQTAQRLGVSTRTLYRYMNKYDLRER